MPRRRPLRHTVFLGLLTGFAGTIAGCSDERTGAGPHAGEVPTTDPELGEDAPINLSYVCGNRFLIGNASAVPVSVSWRVAGTEEEGAADLPAAPESEPAVSEHMIETRTRAAVQLFVDGRLVVARDNDGVPCTPQVASVATLANATASSAGQWTSLFPWPIVAVHLVLLPDGRVLSIGRVGTPTIWNPATGAFTAVTPPAWLFCAGHTLLSDGRVFVAGGHITNDHGLPNTTLFTPSTNTWQSSAMMKLGRWYPTTTTLANGDVLIIAGRDQTGTLVATPEVWSNGSIRQLTSALKTLPYYARAFLAPNGTVYIAGPDQGTRFLNTTGTGSWKAGPKRLGPYRDYGSAVMYDDGKILYAGGNRTTNTAETVNLNLATPAWQWTSPMAFARRHHNLTVLPTGEVLATGGVNGTGFDDVSKPVHEAEIWNPAAGTWTTLASNAVTRGYHGSSLLLPDGRVLNAGSGDGGGAPNEKNGELFSPPYLFRGARPTIGSAPASVRYGAQFRLETPDAGSIAKVSLIRLGAVTHAFDENQRFMRLSFTKDATGLTVTAPSSSNRAPPGHYMVFILNGSDVPSVAKIIRVY
jgi:galactose oxidase